MTDCVKENLELFEEGKRKGLDWVNENYKDPDSFDAELYQRGREILQQRIDPTYPNELRVQIVTRRKKYGLMTEGGILLSYDGLIGWKQLYYTYEGDWDKVIEKYSLIRGAKDNRGQLLWPKDEYSLNIQRFQLFKDRVDLTLNDVRNYFYGNETKMDYNCRKWKDYIELEGGGYYSVFPLMSGTKRWLCDFGKGEEGWMKFVHYVGIEHFLDGTKVIDLGPMHPSQQNTIGYRWLKEKEARIMNQQYIDCLIERIRL